MTQSLYREEHEIFRRSVQAFIAREIAPFHAQWEKDGIVSRDLWRKAGAEGILCTAIPEEYGGAGGDILHAAIVSHELAAGAWSGPGFRVHSDITAFYILNHGTEEQKHTWLPRMASGETVGAIAMTEPGAGSDLQGMRCSAVRDGDHYVINGQKTFITNGQHCDLVVLACKTDPKAGAKGISLILVEADRPGFKRGRNLEKMGNKAQDTSELFFEDVRVPVTNILGKENGGFFCMMQELPQERLMIGVATLGLAEASLEWTRHYVKERKAFKGALGDLQTVRFKLADMKTELTIGRTFLDDCIARHLVGELDVPRAAMAKYWLTELTGRVVDTCVQLHGGYGYMWEYPIARAYADARVHRIYGGSNEIMRELVARIV